MVFYTGADNNSESYQTQYKYSNTSSSDYNHSTVNDIFRI